LPAYADPTVPLLVLVFVAGVLAGALGVVLWRGSGQRLARSLLAEAERARQAETEALLDGVKLAFGDISLETFRRLVDQLLVQSQTALSGERRLQGQQLAAERADLEARMGAVLAQLERMRGLIQELERDREGKFSRLETELRTAGERAAGLVETTRRLADTLANSRARGQWGERLAEDVLRAAGLVENVSFRRQPLLATGQRPDFTILLPDRSVLAMDVKFPLDNLQRSLAAEDREQRGRLEAAFIRDARAKVQEVAERGYIAPEAGTLDVALLFIPNESVFEAVARLAPELVDQALGRGVILVSPLTLVAVLAVLRRASSVFRLSAAARELGRAMAEFRAAWDGYNHESELVGRRLEDALDSYRMLASLRRRRMDRALATIDGFGLEGEPDSGQSRSGAGAAVDELEPHCDSGELKGTSSSVGNALRTENSKDESLHRTALSPSTLATDGETGGAFASRDCT
jgi:DNA recombination protein RmuC